MSPTPSCKHVITIGRSSIRKKQSRPHLLFVTRSALVLLFLLDLPCRTSASLVDTFTFDPKDDPIGHFSTILSSLYQMETAHAFGTTMTMFNNKDGDEQAYLDKTLRVDTNRFVPLEIVAANEAVVYDVLYQAEEAGFVKTLVYRNIIAGKVPILKLPDLAIIPNIALLRPTIVIPTEEQTPADKADIHSNQVTVSSGSVQNEAVYTMNVDDLRTKHPDLDGRGLKIGVMAGTFNCLGGYSADIASGDLPPNVIVMREGPCPGSDAGRVMMQLIYDIAPAAQLLFHTADDGESIYASGIDALAAAGCDVIVTATTYFTEPMFQDGIVAQAVDRAVKRGTAYFTSAGDRASKSYSAPFQPSGVMLQAPFSGELHEWEPGITRFNARLSGNAGLILQWDEPCFSASGSLGSASNLDVYLYDAASNTLILAISSDETGGDAVVAFSAIVPDATYGLEIALNGGPAPGLIKVILTGGGQDTNPFASISPNLASTSTTFGHANAALAAAIGGSDAQTFNYPAVVPVIEPFSGRGGTPILFDKTGMRLPQPEIRQTPLVVGPDNISNTFFPAATKKDRTTRAAVANVAAVALLMMQANPNLTPPEIYQLLADTAIDMDDPDTTAGFDVGFDTKTGYGYVDAERAVEAALAMTPSSEPSMTPSTTPSILPSTAPSMLPSMAPTTSPSSMPSDSPTMKPSRKPRMMRPRLPMTKAPVVRPATKAPIVRPPTKAPIVRNSRGRMQGGMTLTVGGVNATRLAAVPTRKPTLN
jgi:hypothetical protein